MEKKGKKLNLTGKARFEVIRQGITRFQKAMLKIMIGKSKISEELIEEFKQLEALEIKFSLEPILFYQKLKSKIWLHEENISVILVAKQVTLPSFVDQVNLSKL